MATEGSTVPCGQTSRVAPTAVPHTSGPVRSRLLHLKVQASSAIVMLIDQARVGRSKSMAMRLIDRQHSALLHVCCDRARGLSAYTWTASL